MDAMLVSIGTGWIVHGFDNRNNATSFPLWALVYSAWIVIDWMGISSWYCPQFCWSGEEMNRHNSPIRTIGLFCTSLGLIQCAAVKTIHTRKDMQIWWNSKMSVVKRENKKKRF